MKLFNKLTAGLSTAVVAVATLAVALSGTASADCYQYNSNGFTTSATPVFNNICGVPGLNNESDFVRIRQNPATTASPTTDEASGITYSTTDLTAACNNGDLFDVWNYLHNDASQDYNPDTNPSNPSAVAHNVVENLHVPLGTSNSFNFSDTITSSNAATVTDSIKLNCGDKQVELSLVPGSVHTLTAPTGSWNDIADLQAGDNALKVGNPTWGSGDVWGCWNYRILIIYEVKVTVVPPTPQVTASCDMFNVLANSDRTVTVNTFKFTASNVNFKNAVINWGDNNSTQPITDSTKVVGQTHTYANYGTYTVSALVTFDNGATSGGPNTVCSQQVTFTPNQPPVTPPTRLVNTGPGAVVGLFGGASAAGAFGYRKFLSRRLGR